MDRDKNDPKDPLREEPEELQDPTAGQDGDLPFPGMPAASGPITGTDLDGEQDDAKR
ncbi:hypothetical protein QDR37_11460 [Amnibacterium sp. CER49]|uniref:hypothetical protein n=1 Tax=Amnibacterium sp. CER49 TaxID=3039161 RepID=UPI002449DB4E|nr:hypothetical protein [Amnibacterium sp. CER49]MDH2444563.1 hypothetical protein [Amnibacterium sp. CER49]